MKKIGLIFLSTFMFVSLSSMSVHAENSPTPTATPTIAVTATPKVTIVPTVTPSVVVTSTPTATIKVTPTTTITSTPTTTVKATATSKVDSKDDKAGITPDSPIYGLERMIESVQVNLTFSDEGKAELLLSFANERLAEAQIMTEKKNYKLMEKVMKAYIKTVDQANKKAEAATEKDKDLEYVFNGIEITKQTADKIIIKVSGVIPKESEASLKEAVEKIAKRSIVESTFATAKSNLKEADKEQKVAERELKAAQKSGDKTAVAAAEEKLKAAVENKKEMEEIKDELKEYKKEIMDELNMGKCKDKDKKDKLPKIDEKIVMMQQCNKKHGNKHEKIMGNIEAAEKIEAENKQATEANAEQAAVKPVEKKIEKCEKIEGQCENPDKKCERKIEKEQEKTEVNADKAIEDNGRKDENGFRGKGMQRNGKNH